MEPVPRFRDVSVSRSRGIPVGHDSTCGAHRRLSGSCLMKSFRAAVRQDGELWILLVPALDTRTEKGERLIDVEQKLREAIAEHFHIEQNDICLELQDRRGIAR